MTFHHRVSVSFVKTGDRGYNSISHVRCGQHPTMYIDTVMWMWLQM